MHVSFDIELITAYLNVTQMFELRENPEPAIIMAYYPLGNVVDAGIVEEDGYVSAL